MMTRRNMNVQPTIKVPVGYNFTVRVNRDICSRRPTNRWELTHNPLFRQQELKPPSSSGFVILRPTTAQVPHVSIGAGEKSM